MRRPTPIRHQTPENPVAIRRMVPDSILQSIQGAQTLARTKILDEEMKKIASLRKAYNCLCKMNALKELNADQIPLLKSLEREAIYNEMSMINHVLARNSRFTHQDKMDLVKIAFKTILKTQIAMMEYDLTMKSIVDEYIDDDRLTCYDLLDPVSGDEFMHIVSCRGQIKAWQKRLVSMIRKECECNERWSTSLYHRLMVQQQQTILMMGRLRDAVMPAARQFFGMDRDLNELKVVIADDEDNIAFLHSDLGRRHHGVDWGLEKKRIDKYKRRCALLSNQFSGNLSFPHINQLLKPL